MLLFPQKVEKMAGAEQTFYVVSERKYVNEKMGQLLKLAGFSQVKQIQKPLTKLTALPLAAHTRGIIIDIGLSLNPQEITLAIKTLVPRDIWCGVVGDIDSILLAQTYARQGVHYFYIDAEEDELIQAVASGKSISTVRWAVNISVLGCKGGVGNTTIAYQLVNKIIQLRQMPTLFVQGKSGSHDLDLFFDKKMKQNLISVNKHLDMMCLQDDILPQLNNEITEKYNFVVYEETINSAGKEQLRQIIEYSSCLILNLDRSMSSVRVAKQMIEINESINRTQRTPRRLLVCISDSRPVAGDMLSIEDIQALIHRRVDIIFPWRKTFSLNPFFSLKGRTEPLEELIQRVLGTTEMEGRRKTFFKARRAGGS